MTNVCVVQNVSLKRHLALSTYLRNLVESLAATNHIHVTALVSKGYEDERRPKNVDILESNSNLYTISGNLRFIFWAVFALLRISRERPIDVIHCLYPSSSTVACVLYKWIFSPRTKVVYDIRSPWINMSIKRGEIRFWLVETFQSAATVLEIMLLQLVDAAIFITEGLRETYREMGLGVPHMNMVSPSGVDIESFRPHSKNDLRKRIGVGEDVRVIGYVGGISKTREMSFLLRGYEKLVDLSDERWAMVFIGDGDDCERLKQQAEKRNLQRVFFLGRVSHSEIPSMISSFDYGVCHLPDLPLFNTSFPMKVLEYLACGVPVLMSDMPAHKELARRLPGTIIYQFTPESFAKAAMENGNTAVDRSSIEEYSWDSIARSLYRFYFYAL